jgi:uncharacterized protein YlxW (UPF0749 family)
MRIAVGGRPAVRRADGVVETRLEAAQGERLRELRAENRELRAQVLDLQRQLRETEAALLSVRRLRSSLQAQVATMRRAGAA